MIPRIMDDGKLIDNIRNIDGVSAAEKHNGIFVTAKVREFADSDFDMNTVFYGLDEERTLNLLDVSEHSEKNDDTVYIPLFMKELGGFAEGGDITYSIGGEEYSFKIGGIVSEMQYGNYGTGLIGGYFPKAAYEKLADEQEKHLIIEYSLKCADNADLLHVKNAVNDILSDKGIAVLSINDKDASK